MKLPRIYGRKTGSLWIRVSCDGCTSKFSHLQSQSTHTASRKLLNSGKSILSAHWSRQMARTDISLLLLTMPHPEPLHNPSRNTVQLPRWKLYRKSSEIMENRRKSSQTMVKDSDSKNFRHSSNDMASIITARPLATCKPTARWNVSTTS